MKFVHLLHCIIAAITAVRAENPTCKGSILCGKLDAVKDCQVAIDKLIDSYNYDPAPG